MARDLTHLFDLSWLETASQVRPLPLFPASAAGNEVACPYLQLNHDFYLLFRVLSWFHWYHFYLGLKKRCCHPAIVED